MDFLWPGFLILLAAIPLLIAAFAFILRRRKRVAVRYSSLSLVREAIPQYSRVKRFLPMALFLAALSSLVVAMARPVSVVAVPSDRTTIILAMDVSRSMCSTDVLPNRLDAAKSAALSFVARQKTGTQIGVVAFAGFAELIQAPTSEQDALRNTINGLTTGRRTAIGSAILKSIDAIAEIDHSISPSVDDGSGAVGVAPVPKGAYAPHIIVLLTDGANNSGPQPIDAAQQAADRGIRVYTIGFGTAKGSEMPNCSPGYIGGEPNGGFGGGSSGGFGGGQFGGGQFGGGRFRRGIDEDTLKKVASMTDAKYFSAESADELVNAFQNLPTSLIVKHDVSEISFGFALAGALLATIAIVLSLVWHPLL